MLIVSASLLALPRVWRAVRALGARQAAVYLGIGMVVGLHWLSFYAAIQLANASVAATCMALGPVFLAVIEPLLLRRPFAARELLLGLAVVPGVALVLGGVPGGMLAGFGVGVMSAALVALFGALNKRHATAANPLCVTFLELGGGALLLLALCAVLPHSGPLLPLPSPRDAALLLVLAFGCTLLPFALSLVALRQLSAFAVQLAVNLEPVYAVLLAVPLLGEQRELGRGFYLGVAIIVAAVLAYPRLRPRQPAPVPTPANERPIPPS
jgi:drug/metabolite transporter (DMT)-like permease